MVNDLKELDRYPWTGHSAILGKRKNPLIPASAATNKREKPKKSLAEKTIEDVLLHFGNKLMEARRRYRQFVKDGVDQGTRPELQGGGLVRPACHRETRIPGNFRKHNESDRRSYSWNNACKARAGRSAGGDKKALLGRRREEREQSDQRILGSGGFVAEILEESKKRYEKRPLKPPTLQDLTCKVARHIGLNPTVLLSGRRDRKVSRARAIISYLAATEAGYSQTQIADHLNISRIGVRNSILRGQKMILCREMPFDIISPV